MAQNYREGMASASAEKPHSPGNRLPPKLAWSDESCRFAVKNPGPAVRIVAIGIVLVLVAGCASPSGTAAGLTGDERGGKIPYAAGNMPAAMNSVRTHCQQFGKKSFITQMNVASEGGQLVFECH